MKFLKIISEKLLIVIVFSLLFAACRTSDSPAGEEEDLGSTEEWNDFNEDDEGNFNESTAIYDGDYCATVTYHNPNTGTESEYTLTIEVIDNILERINFPVGWLEEEHFGDVEFDEDGYASFTSGRGYEYTVTIVGVTAGCLNNVPMAVQCQGITEDGGQCENLTDNSSGYCWQHEEQEEW